MKFTVQHEIAHTFRAVEEAFLSLGFQATLSDLPDVTNREVISQTTQPDGITNRVVHCTFKRALPSAAKAAIGSETISWTEHSSYSPATRVWELQITPDTGAHLFHCEGTYELIDNGGTTTRVASFEVDVRVPFFGGKVESSISKGLKRNLEEEASRLNEFLVAEASKK